jgi:hydroxymethylglutaryl-CoA lyase
MSGDDWSFDRMSERIVINDVGPRDGLQNQPKILSVEERLAMIRSLAAAGVKHVEVGSFVSPKAVPAMAGTDQVVAGLPDDDVTYSALIPNMKGYELARAAGVKTVAMVIYGSEGMAQANVNMGMLRTEEIRPGKTRRNKCSGHDYDLFRLPFRRSH